MSSGCSIYINSASDTSVSTSGCTTGIDFYVAEAAMNYLKDGSIKIDASGNATGTINFFSTPTEVDTSQYPACNYSVNQTEGTQPMAYNFNSSRSCRNIHLTVNERTMSYFGNVGSFSIGETTLALTLGSMNDIAPSVGVNPGDDSVVGSGTQDADGLTGRARLLFFMFGFFIAAVILVLVAIYSKNRFAEIDAAKAADADDASGDQSQQDGDSTATN